MKTASENDRSGLRILMVIASLGAGGAERVLVALSKALLDQGHWVHVATYVGHERDFYYLDPRVQRDHIAAPAAGARRGRASKLRSNINRLVSLRRIVGRIEPDVVLGFMPEANVLVALQKSDFVRVGSEHVHITHTALSPPWRILRWATYRRLSSLVCLTDSNERAVNQAFKLKKTAVIPNPIEYPIPTGNGVAAEIALQAIPAGVPLVLGVGRLVPQKNFEALIRVFFSLSLEHPDWHLLICGEGDQRDELTELAKQLGIQTRVHLVGNVADMGAVYARSNVLAMTSIFEGFGNVIAEAHQHELPVVAFDCESGPRDQIHDGENGYLVPVGDLDALGATLSSLMASTQLRETLGRNGKISAQRYLPEHVGREYVQHFETLLRSQKGRDKR